MFGGMFASCHGDIFFSKALVRFSICNDEMATSWSNGLERGGGGEGKGRRGERKEERRERGGGSRRKKHAPVLS